MPAQLQLPRACRRPRLACGTRLGSALLLATTAATAQSVTASLEWERAASAQDCVDASALARSIEATLGRKVFVDSAAADIYVTGQIDGSQRQGWRAQLRLRSATGADYGTRDLQTEAANCSALDDALALALSLMLDVAREQIASDAENDGQRAAAGEDAGRPVFTIPRDTPPRRAHWRWGFGAALTTGFGLLPTVGLGPTAIAWARPPHLGKWGIAGSWWLPAEAASSVGRADLRFWSVAISLCPLGGVHGRAAWDACLLQRGGIVRSQGIGFDRNATTQNAVWNAGVGVEWSYELLGPLRLLGTMSAEVPLIRHTFVYATQDGGQNALYRVWAVIPAISAGLGAEL